MKRIALVGLLTLLTHINFAQTKMPKPPTVEDVNYANYVGKWYEIARFDNRFEKGLVGVTATYTATNKPSKIKVLNEGYMNTLNGKHKQSKGYAKVKGEGKLKVTFFWPFAGDYWILDVDKTNYAYALVGTPDFKYLWVLSRLPKLDKTIYDGLIAKAKGLGYPTEQLLMVGQPDEMMVKPPVKSKKRAKK
jgi:apolipoprotein D and lipocalin family protein